MKFMYQLRLWLSAVIAPKLNNKSKSNCDHLLVDGFGGMGDALVCIHCGLDKYPEALPWLLLTSCELRGRVIRSGHPEYKEYLEKAKQARMIKESKGE